MKHHEKYFLRRSTTRSTALSPHLLSSNRSVPSKRHVCTSQRYDPRTVDIHHFLCPYILDFEPLSSRPDAILLSTILNLIVAIFHMSFQDAP